VARIQIKNKNNKHLFCIGILIGGNFIGIELDDEYFEIAKQRISEAQNTPEQVTLFDIEERSNTDRMADRGRTSGGVWEMKKEQVNEKD